MFFHEATVVLDGIRPRRMSRNTHFFLHVLASVVVEVVVAALVEEAVLERGAEAFRCL